MSETLNITSALSYKCKNIFTLRDPFDATNLEPGPTKMNIILPDSYVNGNPLEDVENHDEIEIFKVPFSRIDLPSVDLRINLRTADNVELGEITYGDELILSDGVVPIGGDIIIPNQEQISLTDQIYQNTHALLLNKLGLDESEYIDGACFELLAHDESLENLTVGVSVRTRRKYLELIDWIKNTEVEKDLSEDRIAIINQSEYDKNLQAKNSRTIGQFAVMKVCQLSAVVKRFI